LIWQESVSVRYLHYHVSKKHTSWERAACLASLPGLETANALGFEPVSCERG
jgi:hypothetical protein